MKIDNNSNVFKLGKTSTAKYDDDNSDPFFHFTTELRSNYTMKFY